MIGVVGGMGPDATILFLQMVVEMTDAARDQDHVDLDILMHCSIPDRTAHILDPSAPSPVPPISADLRLLVERGASAIAIPCNTTHVFLAELQRSCPVPILDMPALASDRVRRAFPAARRVAVLATRGTMRAGIYRTALASAGLEPVEIDEALQEIADSVIYDRVKAGLPVEPALYLDLLDRATAAGAEVVLLACTELSVADRRIAHDRPTIDAMAALAEATVLAAGKRIRGA
jgi:aspartate racemase